MKCGKCSSAATEGSIASISSWTASTSGSIASPRNWIGHVSIPWHEQGRSGDAVLLRVLDRNGAGAGDLHAPLPAPAVTRPLSRRLCRPSDVKRVKRGCTVQHAVEVARGRLGRVKCRLIKAKRLKRSTRFEICHFPRANGRDAQREVQ